MKYDINTYVIDAIALEFLQAMYSTYSSKQRGRHWNIGTVTNYSTEQQAALDSNKKNSGSHKSWVFLTIDLNCVIYDMKKYDSLFFCILEDIINIET